MTTFTDERRLTWEQAKAELLRISTTRGEHYVYPGASPGGGDGCRYRWEEYDVQLGRCGTDDVSKPACLLGQAMFEWGLLDDLVGYYDDEDGTGFWHNNDGISAVLSPDVLPASVRDWRWVALLFERAQINQDNGQEWPVAVRAAIAHVDGLIEAADPDMVERPEGWTRHQWSA